MQCSGKKRANQNRGGGRQSRKAECYDNAVVESFFGTLKTELVYVRPTFATYDEARAAIFDYIEVFHNRRRMHSRLGCMTPIAYESRHQQGFAAQQNRPLLAVKVVAPKEC